MSRPVSRAAVCTLASLALLAACTSAPEARDDTIPDVTDLVDQIAVPAALEPATESVRDLSVVGPDGDLPGLVVGLSAPPGEQQRLAMWTLRGGNPHVAQLDARLKGSVQTAVAAGDESLTAIVGSVWDDGVVRSFVLTSTDRSTWTPVELGSDLARIELTAVTVADGVVHAAGDGADGSATVVTVADGTPRTTSLATEGDAVTLTGIAAHADDVLVVGAQDADEAFAWVSEDAGASFGSVVEIFDGGAAEGAVHTGAEWVVTGTVWGDGGRVPAAWVSPDGAVWAHEDVAAGAEVAADGWTPWGRGNDATLGRPAVSDGGTVHLWAGGEASVWGVVYAREDAGWTAYQSMSLPEKAHYIGIRGAVAPTGDLEGSVALEGGGWAAVASYGGDAWSARGTLAERAEPYSLHEGRSTDAGVEFVASSSVFRHDDERGWTLSSEGTAFLLEGGQLREVDQDLPAGIDAGERLTDPETGAQVMLGWHTETFEVSGWRRPTQDGAWAPASMDLTGVQAWQALERLPSGFVALVGERPSTAMADTMHLVVLTSVDGEAWERVGAEAMGRPEAGGTSGADVCEAPSGDVVVTGTTRRSTPEVTAAAWSSAGGWGPLAVDEAPSRSSFGSCVSTDTGVVTVLTAPGATQVWRSDDGGAFTFGADLGAGSEIASLTRVDGTIVGVGARAGGEYDGPVLWLSPDGTEWSWVPLPSRERHLSQQSLAVIDGALVVTASHVTGQQAWRVDDIAALAEAAQPID